MAEERAGPLRRALAEGLAVLVHEAEEPREGGPEKGDIGWLHREGSSKLYKARSRRYRNQILFGSLKCEK